MNGGPTDCRIDLHLPIKCMAKIIALYEWTDEWMSSLVAVGSVCFDPIRSDTTRVHSLAEYDREHVLTLKFDINSCIPIKRQG